MESFSHLDQQGLAKMVDVSEKLVNKRFAMARSTVVLPADTLRKLLSDDMQTHKGSVFHAATIAGIMAAKKTGELIPLCHPLGLDKCDVNIKVENNEIIIECSASVEAKTGVEMEALVGASVAALTIYDMCKSMSHDIVIKETMLIQKTGGKNDFKRTT